MNYQGNVLANERGLTVDPGGTSASDLATKEYLPCIKRGI